MCSLRVLYRDLCQAYQAALGDQLDGPRGRIYPHQTSTRQRETASRATQSHLDRCLTCRNCREHFLPFGVAYGQLLDVGRKELSSSK
jgi:glycolate oxidase iron-sulfur subunit